MRKLTVTYTGGFSDHLEGSLEKLMVDKLRWKYVSHKDYDNKTEINFVKDWVVPRPKKGKSE